VSNFNLQLPQSSLSLADLTLRLNRKPLNFNVAILPGSHVTPSDLSAFVPALANVTSNVMLDAEVIGSTDRVRIEHLAFNVLGTDTGLRAKGDVARNALDLSDVHLHATGSDIANTVGLFTALPERAADLLPRLGLITLDGAITASREHINLDGTLNTALGNVTISADAKQPSKAVQQLAGTVDCTDLNLGELLQDQRLGLANFSSEFDLTRRNGKNYGTLLLDVANVEWNEHNYTNIATNFAVDADRYSGSLDIDDEYIALDANGIIDLTPGANLFDFTARVDHASLYNIGVWNKYPNHTVTGDVDAKFTGSTLDTVDGQVMLSNLSLTDTQGDNSLRLGPMIIDASNSSFPQRVSITSDLLNASIEGSFNVKTLPTAVQNILAQSLPELFTPKELPADSKSNEFRIDATIHDDSRLFGFLNLPIRPIYPVTCSATMSQKDSEMLFDVNMPYLQQGDKLIRRTSLNAVLGSESKLAATTTMPTKDGDMVLNIGSELTAAEGVAATDISWNVARKHRFGGAVNLNVRPLRNGVDVNIKQSEMAFNDTVWQISPATISVRPKHIAVDGVKVAREGQQALINGTVSTDSTDVLTVQLDNINLDYIFETLSISDAVVFGGNASGTITAASLLSGAPMLQTDNLTVKGISYNHCCMGDALITADWNNATQGIDLHADLDHLTGNSSVIEGAIYPLTESLDFRFHAHRAPVGFLLPFMSAFASDVDGYASGDAHLYGTFKLIDMTGDLHADDFSLKLAFTNVRYFASDSIHLKPGAIDINGLTLRDKYGHTATLNGRLTHKYFKAPAFDFRVSGADNLLVYDIPSTTEQRWYGTIFGSGSAYVTGVPGEVNIGATMVTSPKTDFTFVISDAEEALEYNFLTFRDRELASRLAGDQIATERPPLGSEELDMLMQAKLRKIIEEDMATAYNMNFQVDITPEARMNLLMDPIGGDKITAYGTGHVNMLYGSGNDDLRMYGSYNLSRGDYNFTLQDIIIKNFSIRDGSTIAFHGDPYAAQLDISAIYQLNANLSDLDESFLNDKEISRTNVPVQAVLNVDGDIRQPGISFDLEFPTLTADVARKVHTIVSTDEMMNRQIIYLLALNRFYTPDYMASTTKGNELMSVASSTISSQLSNILGQLSDKFSVAPTLRTDAADFSDVEFDVALSSTLLNNRLLLNGNLGYRDKALNNNNQFIGDFDVEYLLNRGGNWRLKAYNHFNDRNLYIKTATTTQGIGIVFKHDFDDLMQILRRHSH
jgi:hypothetical protein